MIKHTHLYTHAIPLIIIGPILTYFRRQVIWCPNTSPGQFLSTINTIPAIRPDTSNITHFLSTLAIPKSPSFTIPFFIRKIFLKDAILFTQCAMYSNSHL